ncbi:AI-2E family transporter [Saccharopolyspora sp. NFXS83]|uniref:AI-2E family transporter n=1 Tax=Saccharopolyspora sp. NFXS83 TaxID=2993560 RepID=UPI00224AE4D4|nr:AI-2E family transporter [Saccharopolyspora sp. NFXS83]MCX2731323.1 AI-2E family transporter [Saccharopolyspora sp. NFXS83]
MSNSKITAPDDAATHVPLVLRVTAAVCWRLLVVLGMLYVLSEAVGRLNVVVIPVAIALLLAALLAPAVSWLARLRVPRAISTAVVLVGGLALVGGVLTFVINAFVNGFPELQRQILRSLGQIRGWLLSGPLHLREEQIDQYLGQAADWLQENQAALTSGALSTASTFGNFLTGLVLALFTLIFFLHDGRRVWLFMLGLVPSHVRDRVDVAGVRGFASLVGYVRATTLVAVADAVGIGIGLAIIGVPLALPLAALVFLGGFVPIVGAVASGSVAVLIALVTNGPVDALLVVLVVLLVQQIEGNVLQPLLLGRAVQVHALAVVLAISAGVVLAGIVGALLAVPLVAVLNSAIRSLAAGEGSQTPVDPTDPHEAEPPARDSAEDTGSGEPAKSGADSGEDSGRTDSGSGSTAIE